MFSWTCRSLQLPLAIAPIHAYSRESWEADVLLLASLMYTYWRQEIFIYGIAMDAKTFVADKGATKFSNAHLGGIVRQALDHGGIHIAKGDMDCPERLLPAVPGEVIKALNDSWNAALSARTMLEWTFDLYPEARRLSQTHGQVDRGGNAHHWSYAILDYGVPLIYVLGQTYGWLGSDQSTYFILVTEMLLLLDPLDDDLCLLQVPLLVSPKALQRKSWLPARGTQCIAPWTFSKAG